MFVRTKKINMKEIKNTKGLYFASNDGDIYRNGKKLKAIDNGNGYLCIVLSINGKTKRHYIHRLICETYKDNKESKKEVNHLDGSKSNNRADNLEWVTRSENQYHRYTNLGHHGVNKGKVGIMASASKCVVQTDLQGKYIKEYFSVLEAQKQTGVGESCIRAVTYGRQKTAGGYKWYYKNEA